MINIYDLTFKELSEWAFSADLPGYRAKQIWQGLYQSLLTNWEDFTTLPKDMRLRMATEFQISTISNSGFLLSSDGDTRKFLFRLEDGALIESVIMEYTERNTLCISSQSGCAMGCVFCATGQMGFGRNLRKGEIVEQVITLARVLRESGKTVTNIVLMGMGEPFHNYDNTLGALYILNDAQGMNIGARRFTISTVGLVGHIERFTSEHHQMNLAISLHAADDATRSALLPINRKHNISNLLDACYAYTKSSGRRISFEWALIANQNDDPITAHKLARLLKGMLCHVNLIPLNPTANSSLKAPSRERVEEFRAILEENGIPASVRVRRGIDIMAGCGQLAARSSPTRSV